MKDTSKLERKETNSSESDSERPSSEDNQEDNTADEFSDGQDTVETYISEPCSEDTGFY